MWRGVWRGEDGIREGGARRGRACVKHFKRTISTRQTQPVSRGAHLDYIYSQTSPDNVFGNLLFGECLAVISDNLRLKAPPSSSPIFFLSPPTNCLFSRWWPHKAHWKMSSGGVREAIWGLIDGSRRTAAAMFSDLPVCEPCLALSGKREKFFFQS